MTEPTPTANTLTLEDFQAGDFLFEDKLLDLLELVYYLRNTHNHDGGTGDGGTLVTADPKSIMYYGGAAAS